MSWLSSAPPQIQYSSREEWSDDSYAKRNRDLHRVELCKHGMNCSYNQQGVCAYAHHLYELMPPNESVRAYEGVWKDGVDRFFGQAMSDEQIRRIKTYYERTEKYDRPMWSHALCWFCSNTGSFAEYPHDFGLEQDWKTVSMFRVHSWKPFQWMPGLWDRIEERRQRLQRAALPSPSLTLAPVSAIASPVECASVGVQVILASGEAREASVPTYVIASGSSGISADVQPEEERPPVSSKQLTMSALTEVGIVSHVYSDNQKMGDSKDIEQLPTMYPEGAKTTASEQTEQLSPVYFDDEICRALKAFRDRRRSP